MSSLLEQAIVDAKALKEAALKSAESSILEKYAPEIKDAVSNLLEQEDELGMEPAPEVPENPVPRSAEEGMRLCPCPDDDEEIEIDFEDLRKAVEDEGEGDEVPPMDLGMEDEEGLELTEAVLASLLEEEEEDDSDDKEEGDEEKETLNEEMYDCIRDLMGDGMSYGQAKAECKRMYSGRRYEENIAHEEVELTEENLDAILEELIVDIKPQKSGWAGTPASVMNHNAELELARLASTEAQEEIKVLKQALSNVKKDYAQLSESHKGTRTMNKRLANTVSSLKDKLEEVNLTNARLFYTNRVLNSDSLNERQKNKIAEAISESRSVNEAKIVFETLQNAVGSSSKKSPKSLSEAINRNSPLMARRGSSSSADNTQVERMQRLAGIKNN